MSTIKKTTHKQMQTRILKSVWRIAHAAAIIAPQGPPEAVPAAISATALPPSTPAFTVAAAAFAVASAPFAAAVVAAVLLASLPTLAACFAALAAFCAAHRNYQRRRRFVVCSALPLSAPPIFNCIWQCYFRF